MTTDGLSRRHALTGAATVGLGLPLLAACGGGGSGTASPATSEAATSGGGGGSADVLATTDQIEVGGGTVFADQQVVVTQPSQGDFKGFSSTCTHQGCTVGSVADGQINCPCHGSQFSIEDGSVTTGPATTGLPEVQLDVQGTNISLA